MVEPSNYIDYKLDLPRIPDNLLFTTPTEIRENCELKWDAYVYKTYLAPQELYDWVHTQESIQRELKMYIEDHLQIRYQVMTEQLPIHQDADAKGVDWVLNYHIDLGGPEVYTRWWDMPEDFKGKFIEGSFDYHMGDYYDETKKLHEEMIPTHTWHRLRVDIPHDIGRISTPRFGLRLWNSWIGQS